MRRPGKLTEERKLLRRMAQDVADVHTLLLAHGKDATLRTDVDRAVVEAAAGYLSSEDTDIGYLFSGWAQAALPHRRLPDDAPWQVTTDRVTLIVQPGLRPAPGGKPISVGVPYGSRARLILLYLQTEAIRTNSREVELGRSLHAWLRRLEIPIGGKQMATVRDQAERISRCRLSFQIKQGSRTGLVNQHILETSMFIEDDTAQGGLFVETASLSQSFFEELKKHPVPVEEAAVRQLANNSLALDVYCWLAYRLHSLKEPITVSWKALHGQFGRSVARLDHFKEHFRTVLLLATSVYPDAKLEEAQSGVGLVLKPSKPPVPPRGGLAARPRLNLIAGSR
jgi:Plasmid encoded RepA protein